MTIKPGSRVAAIGISSMIAFSTLTACSGSPDSQANCPGPTTPTITVNAENVSGLPTNFRAFPQSVATLTSNNLPADGLANIRVAGSHQPSEMQLAAVYQRLASPPANVVVLDLRRESHGFFGGNAVEWYGPKNGANNDISIPQINALEKQQLASLTPKTPVYSIVQLCRTDASIGEAAEVKLPGKLTTGTAEASAVTAGGAAYQRIYAADYQPLTNAQVDQFLAIYRPLPKTKWLYVHGAASQRRTGTVLAMADMLSNAKTLSLDSIVQRQAKLGSAYLLDLGDTAAFEYPQNVIRAGQLRAFYLYAQQYPLGAPNPPTFSAWVQTHPSATAAPPTPSGSN